MDGLGGKKRARPSRNSGPGAPSGYTLFRCGRRVKLKKESFLKQNAFKLFGGSNGIGCTSTKLFERELEVCRPDSLKQIDRSGV